VIVWIRVVAPAADVSPLQWLASDEDEAREKAAGVASEAAESVEPEAARTEAEVGDTDPVQAIEDALGVEGLEILEIPLSPNRLWELVEAAKGKS